MNVILEQIATQWPLVIMTGLGVYFFAKILEGQKRAKDQSLASVAKAREQLEAFAALAEGHWERLEGRIEKVEDDLADHLSSLDPHKTCEAEHIAIADVVTRLDRVQKGIGRLESWIMYMASGAKMPLPKDLE